MKINPFAFGNYRTLILVLSIMLTACEKNDTEPKGEELPDNSVELTENAFIIENDNSSLISDSAQQANGTYIFQFNNEVPSFKNGDVIVGQEGNGFLRKITEISIEDNTATLETQEASLDELFQDANLNFGLEPTSEQHLKSMGENDVFLANGVSTSDGFTFSLNQTEIIDNEQIAITIEEGTFSFTPDFKFKIKYEDKSLKYLDFRTVNSPVHFDANITIRLSKDVPLKNFTKTLAKTKKKYLTTIGWLPVLVVVETQLDATVDASIDAELDASFGVVSNNKLTMGANYDGGEWTGLYELNTENNEFSDMDISGKLMLNQTLTIVPRVNIKLYNVVGPYVIPKIKETYEFGISTDLDRNSEMNLYLDTKVGVEGKIFSKSLFNYSNTFNWEKQLWNSPDSIEIVSGNEQTGNLGEYLSKPIKIKVVDLYKNAVPNIPVYFNVETKYGKLSADVVMTNESGIASVEWELGNEEEQQELTAIVKKANGTIISKAPAIVRATAGPSLLGTWEAYESSGIAIGEWSYDYYSECPDLLNYAYRDIKATLSIVPTDLTFYSKSESKDYIYKGLDIDNCNYESVSIDDTIYESSNSIEFMQEGNKINIPTEDGPFLMTYEFQGTDTLVILGEGETVKFFRQ